MSEYSVRIEPNAWKQVMSLKEPVREKILVAIENLEETLRPSGCKKLKGKGGLFRVRVGDYRVIRSPMEGKGAFCIVVSALVCCDARVFG